MTSGSVSIKNFSWALKTKKRHRSGSGGSKDHEAKKKSFLSRRQNTPGGRRASQPNARTSSNLEVVAPVTSDVEFKYTWPIESFLKLVKSGGRGSNNGSQGGSNGSNLDTCDEEATTSVSSGGGLDSAPFEININGVETTWNLSIRFWTGEDGERLANPFVLCLNMLSCSVANPLEVGIKYKFGVLNRSTGILELGSPEIKPDLKLETTNELRSIGYKNIAISDKHLNQSGDIQLVCKMRLLKDDSEIHSLSSDLRGMINDEKSSDLVLEAGGKSFKVHRNILCARSPVFADLLTKQQKQPLKEVKVETEDKENKENIISEKKEKPAAIQSPPSRATEKIELTDMKADTLRELLTYVYTDSSTHVDMMANALLVAADTYQLAGLKNNCEKHLGEILSPNNVSSVLLMADKYKCQNLKKSALSYCKQNHTYIMKDDHWKTIEEEKPDLFEEAVSEVVAKSSCNCHTECLKKKGKRYEIEKNSSIPEFTKEE